MTLLDADALYQRGIRYSRTQLWRLIRAGKFPKPIKLGAGGRNAWVEAELDEYIAKLIAERDSTKGEAA